MLSVTAGDGRCGGGGNGSRRLELAAAGQDLSRDFGLFRDVEPFGIADRPEDVRDRGAAGV